MSATKEHYHDDIERGSRKIGAADSRIERSPWGDALVTNRGAESATPEHPILFSAPMIRAILEGRKTQTRRVSGLDRINENPDHWILKNKWRTVNRFWDSLKEKNPNPLRRYFVFENKFTQAEIEIRSKYGDKPGDLLWVRETTAFTIGEHQPYYTISYKADNFHKDINRPGVDYPEEEMCKEGWYDGDLSKELKWTPSIHVKKIYSRIWLEVEEIKAERITDITYEDCLMEGLEMDGAKFKNYLGGEPIYNHRLSFKTLWESINGEQSWKANPWVWVVKFNVLSTTGKENIQHPVINLHYKSIKSNEL